MSRLLSYLQENGILLCNQNPYLPALEDIGCSWLDVTELIDRQELFYCKAFRKRTTYLSREAYYLLKNLRTKKPMDPDAERIYRLLEGNPPQDTKLLRAISGLPAKSYTKSFDFLLQNLYITALENGEVLNENWSTFYYGTAAEWERRTLQRCSNENARERLWELFSKTMSEKDFRSMTR